MTNEGEAQAQEMLQVINQKLGNLELTLHALLSVLEKNDMVDEEDIQEEAQEVVEAIQNGGVQDGEE